MFSKNKKQKNISRILIETIVVFIITYILTCMAQPGFSPPRASARQKACFSNIRILTGAVEMYNMDHKELIDEFNEKTLNLLYDGKYLKGDIYLPTPRCKYYSKGDLKDIENGYIYCEYHGDLEKRIPDKIDENLEYQLREKAKTKKIISLGIPALIISALFFLQAIIF